jgi:hypothetical protein
MKSPTCPCCKTEMKPKVFGGYYESFTFWGCMCTETETFIPGSTIKAGAFSGYTEGELAKSETLR